MSNAKFYGKIEKTEKQADGTMIVMGYASSESKDVDGEIIKADAIKDAIPHYMQFANVREMHKADKASGTVLEMEVQDDGRTWVKTHIVDAEACKKVEHKVYKGFSIGGRITKRDSADKSIIKSITLSEISLVDRPANPDSVFTFAKVDSGVDDKTEATKPVDAKKADNNVDKKPEELNTSAAPVQKTDATNTTPASATDKAPATDSAAGAGAATDDKTAAARGKTDDVKKGMSGVSCLAGILASINYLQSDTAWEAEYEGDKSTMPAQLKTWLKSGGEILKAMVTEEIAEMTPEDESDIADMLTLADKAKDLMKVACAPEDAAKFVKGFDILATRRGGVLAKAGKRNSAADQKHVDAIHDAACAMGAKCDSTKAAGTGDDLQKRALQVDDIAKALSEIEGDDIVAKVGTLIDVSEALAKRVKEFEAMPKPSKAVVRVVEKGSDGTKNDAVKVEESDSGTDALKKVWGAGGQIV